MLNLSAICLGLRARNLKGYNNLSILSAEEAENGRAQEEGLEVVRGGNGDTSLLGCTDGERFRVCLQVCDSGACNACACASAL